MIELLKHQILRRGMVFKKLFREVMKGKFKRFFILSIEVIGAATAIIAFYEVFLSRKYVDNIAHEFNLCEANSIDANILSLSKQFEDHADTFVYLSLKVNSQGSEIGKDCDGDPFGNVSFDKTDKDQRILYLPPSHYLDVIKRESAFITLKVHFDLVEIEKSVLAQAYFNPFEESVTIEGLFFADFDGRGEAGSNYYLIPAPYGIQTQEIGACTRSLIGAQYPEKIWTYVSNCILN